MHTVVRAFEARWGLTAMSPQDRTAVRRPSTGEKAKADRRGLLETARESLQRTVRTAAALAHDDADFLDRLRDAGLRVRELCADGGGLAGHRLGARRLREAHLSRTVGERARHVAAGQTGTVEAVDVRMTGGRAYRDGVTVAVDGCSRKTARSLEWEPLSTAEALEAAC
ncbi:hypothetical protein ACFWFZ_32830 [Streptomyces sp. NPDC060232]|uniref:hypothetical protein n=1 Tax=Streptomyces sp. NPDC060232 TaxID=3347079 RepID=UPI0036654167